MFLHEIQQITVGLSGRRIPLKLLAAFIGLGAEIGFQDLRNICRFGAIQRRLCRLNRNIVDAIAFQSAEYFHILNCGINTGQIMEENHFTRHKYGKRALQLVKRRGVVLIWNHVLGQIRFASEHIQNRHSEHQICPSFM